MLPTSLLAPTGEFWLTVTKMLDFGVEERWKPEQCQKKWDEVSPISRESNASVASTPIPQPTPLRRATTALVPERWMKQDLLGGTVSRAESPMSIVTTRSPAPFARHPFGADAFEEGDQYEYQQ